MGSFRRSGVFELVGVVVVAALVAAIALFMVTFFILQARDVSRAAGDTASVTPPQGEIADPTTLSEPELWAALAIGPIYLFGTFIPILIGAPLIGLIALSKSFSLLRGERRASHPQLRRRLVL